jgi:hypothetical protein
MSWSFPADSLFISRSASVGTSHSKLPPDGNDSRIYYSHVVRVLAHHIPNVIRMVAIPEFLILCCASVGAPHPPDGNNSRIPYSEGSLPHKQNFLKFKHENVIKMKNKPALALSRPSNLSNEIKKGYQNFVRLSL